MSRRTVVRCQCGRDFDGFSVESARQAFEDHLTEHTTTTSQEVSDR